MRLALLHGDHQIALSPGTFRIGRDAECEVCLSHESVSRLHASIRVTPEGAWLEDHRSRNGVRVNGKRVQVRAPLQAGDQILVGNVGLSVVAVEDPKSEPPETRPLPQVPERGLDAIEALSPREHEVLIRLGRGETQRAIAEELGLSVKTVETYRARITEKLGLKSRADLVRFAVDVGILRPR